MKDFKYEILILGLGNLLMSDDGLGVWVIEELKKKEWKDNILCLEAGSGIINCLAAISVSQKLMVVDAIKGGGKPGSLYSFSEEKILGQNTSNPHGLSLPEVLWLARKINGLPKEVFIYGVEPEKLSLGTELSPIVAKSLPLIIEKMTKEIENLDHHSS